MEEQLLEQNKTLLSQVESKSKELVKSKRLATIGTMASRIAHDLKQPLTVMYTYAEILTPEILSKLDSKDKEKWLRLQNSIFDMNRIIEDVLDFARTTEIKKKKSSLLSILRLAINHVKFSYGIEINLPENDVFLRCDARKIEGVLSNLLNNTVQALDGQGEIDVTISSDSKFVTIQVKDSGPGIPEEHLEKIFEPPCLPQKRLELDWDQSFVKALSSNMKAISQQVISLQLLPLNYLSSIFKVFLILFFKFYVILKFFW